MASVLKQFEQILPLWQCITQRHTSAALRCRSTAHVLPQRRMTWFYTPPLKWPESSLLTQQ